MTKLPLSPLPAHLQVFLAGPHPAVVATLRDDGSPVSAASWYRFDKGSIFLSVSATGQRLRHVRRDPRVALTVLGDSWYTHVSLLGTVVEISEDADFSLVDALARHYTGEPYPNHDAPGFVLRAEVERWHSFGEPGGSVPAP